MTRTNDNIKEAIEVELNYPKSIFSGTATYSTLFLSPMYNISINTELYVNAFMDDFELPHLFKRPYFLLLKVGQFTPHFARVDRVLRENPNFVYTYPVGSVKGDLLYMYVFECPKMYEADYAAFKEGRYSNFSSNLKNKFVRTMQAHNGTIVESPLYGAVHKTPKQKERMEDLLGQRLRPTQEYFGIPTDSMEVFRHKQPTLLNVSS